MGVSAFAKRHPVVTYYGLMFATSWGLGLIVLGPDGFVGRKPISGAQLPLVYVAALAGPSVAGLLSIGLMRGRQGMQDLLSMIYLWLKAGHIIFVIFWMAGLFMLPRYFVYHQEAAPGSPEGAAWVGVSRVLLNLDEFITRE